MRVLTSILVEHDLWLLATATRVAGPAVTLRLWRRAIRAPGRRRLDWRDLAAMTAGASIRAA